MSRLSLLVVVCALVAVASAVSAASPIVRLAAEAGSSSTGVSPSPVVASSSTGAAGGGSTGYIRRSSSSTGSVVPVAPSSTGAAAPVMVPIVLATATICSVNAPAPSVCSTTQLTYGVVNCLAVAATKSIAILPNVIYHGALNYTEFSYSTASDCSGPSYFLGSGKSIAPKMVGRWSNITVPAEVVFKNTTGNGANTVLTWTLDIGLAYVVTPTEDDSSPDVMPLMTVLIFAGVLLCALIIGANIMKSWQGTKYVPARTIGGDAVAAGSYGKF